MKQFGKILKFELKYYLKNKVFVGVTIFLVLLIAAVMFFPRISAMFEKGDVTDTPREASEMFQCIKYEDKREVFGFKIHSFSTLDRIKKYDDSDNGKSAKKPYSIEVGEIERTINLYAIATTKFQVAV